MATLIEFKPESAYPYAQGFCVTDRYIYIFSIKDNTGGAVYQYDRFMLKRIKKDTFEGLYLHANDFAWNSDEKRIYCAAGAGTKNVGVFDEQLNHIRTVSIPFSDIVSLSGIAYDPITKLTAIYGGDSRRIFIVKDLDDHQPMVTGRHAGSQKYQGIAFYDGVLYGIYSSGKIRVTNMQGELIKNTSVTVAGEAENIKIYHDKILYNVQGKMTGLYSAELKTVVKNQMIV